MDCQDYITESVERKKGQYLQWEERGAIQHLKMEQVKEHKWSLDACAWYARLHKLFSAEEMVCTHTLYNEVWAGSLDLSVTELPEAI